MLTKNDHGNNMWKSCEKNSTKKANTTTSKCGGWRLGHFVAKNITHEKVIQAKISFKNECGGPNGVV